MNTKTMSIRPPNKFAKAWAEEEFRKFVENTALTLAASHYHPGCPYRRSIGSDECLCVEYAKVEGPPEAQQRELALRILNEFWAARFIYWETGIDRELRRQVGVMYYTLHTTPDSFWKWWTPQQVIDRVFRKGWCGQDPERVHDMWEEVNAGN